MIYTFREVAIIYTTVQAESEEQAWKELDIITMNNPIPDCVEVDTLECQIQDISGEGVCSFFSLISVINSCNSSGKFDESILSSS